MEERVLHRVCAKVAIYSPDGLSVLVNNIPSLKGHGLPGGHLNANENPLDALKRELFEELVIDDVYDFELKDSWFHEYGKLIIGYVAKRDSLDLPPAPHPQDEFGEWIKIKDITNQLIGSYADFIKKHQPKVN